MTRSVVALALALALVAAARAQDSFKWDPKVNHKPAVGYKHFTESTDVEKQSVRVTVEKQTLQKKDEDAKTVYRYTSEVLEVDGDDVTKESVKVEKWSRTEAEGDADTSLEGKTIVVKGKRPDKTWECKEKESLSEAAVAWVEKELAKKRKKKGEDDEDAKKDEDREDPMKKFAGPEKPVGDGEEWTRDPEKLAKALFGDEMPIDKEKSSVKGKLSNVKVEDGVHVGHIDLKIILAIAKSEKLTEGGTVDLDVQMDGSLEEDKRDAAKAKMTMKLDVKSIQQSPQGTVKVKVKVDNTTERSSGPIEK
jgi:hypothetical protein